MEHQRARRVSLAITFVAAMAIAIGLYVAGTVADSPGNSPSNSTQTVLSTADASTVVGADAEIDAGAPNAQSIDTQQQGDTHEPNRAEPENETNDD